MNSYRSSFPQGGARPRRLLGGPYERPRRPGRVAPGRQDLALAAQRRGPLGGQVEQPRVPAGPGGPRLGCGQVAVGDGGGDQGLQEQGPHRRLECGQVRSAAGPQHRGPGPPWIAAVQCGVTQDAPREGGPPTGPGAGRGHGLLGDGQRGPVAGRQRGDQHLRGGDGVS
ncbi:hypothetical protein [Streptomyces sp. H27-H5]|uniref:hypothetical protein n=1 Tax=Streptomyces sp. H27-H5 TaxID=2996460 RepID=UPI00226F87D2|nr:hypothetical protein [Streptomyces sp. H27-H5]MCY0960285.1 hypothetical protein [Streptomyces sp. H27-H5]